jgi:hypothetical protein
MSLGQGLLMVLAGAAVALWPPHLVIACFGAAGMVAALVVILDRSRTRSRSRAGSGVHSLGRARPFSSYFGRR